jgi:phosphatidylinositol alpha-1,6-mannosyltransferase
MPIIDRADCVLLIAGSGIFAQRAQSVIDKKGLGESVFMLGKVDEEVLGFLYNTSDVFIMPNIPVEGDMEGFGLVALEAASCALPVVASNLEGIRAAIQDGKNGFLIEPRNAERFAKTITKLLENDALRKSYGAQAREFTLKTYGWERVAQYYLKLFNALVNNLAKR